jgi:peroxiredoxin
MTTAWIAAFIALWAFVVVLALLVLGTLRRIVPVIERSEEVIASAAKRLAIGGLPPGTTVPPFTGDEIGGAKFTELDLRGSTTIVLFLGSGCRACEHLVRDLELKQAPEVGARLVVVSGSPAEARLLASSADVTVLVDEERELARAFESAVAPHAFVIDEYGVVVSSGVPSDWNDVQHLGSTTGGGDRRPNIAAAALRW